MADEFGLTLGRMIRAGRLRYGWMGSLGAFMRLSVVSEDLFRAELVPPDDLPKTGSKGPSIIWYSPGSDIRGELELLCRRVVVGGRPGHLRKPVTFLFDGNGTFKGWATSL